MILKIRTRTLGALSVVLASMISTLAIAQSEPVQGPAATPAMAPPKPAAKASNQPSAKVPAKPAAKAAAKTNPPPQATPVPSAGVLQMTPQTIVDLTLSRGYRARAAELTAQRAYVQLEKALGVFDLHVYATPSYEYSETPNLTNSQDVSDRTTTIPIGIGKKFRTGTTLNLDYNSVVQNATLQSNVTTRDPNSAIDGLQLTLRQQLVQNSFGYADRLGVEIGKAGIEAAAYIRESNLQSIILDSMTLFWNAYIAERQLRENLNARDKYVELVKSTRQKMGFNLSSPGELPRLEAEAELAEQRVKASSAAYLNSLTALLTAVQLETKDTIEIQVPEELPPVPQLNAVDIANLRIVRAAKIASENANRLYSATVNAYRPKVDLVAKARTTGADTTNNDALAKMQSGSKPYYYIGVEIDVPIDSDLARGFATDADIGHQLADNDLKLQTDNARDQLSELERSVSSQYAIAKSSIDTVDLRQRVVRELETAYRQGRQPLVELIRAYNDYFGSLQDRATAIGRYHIFLNQFAAARDELVMNKKK